MLLVRIDVLSASGPRQSRRLLLAAKPRDWLPTISWGAKASEELGPYPRRLRPSAPSVL